MWRRRGEIGRELAANILAQKIVPDLRAERERGGREHPPSLGGAAADDGQIGSPHQLPPFPSVRAKPRTDGKADGRERGERAKHWRARAPYSSSLRLLPRSGSGAADVEFSRVRHHRRRLRHRVTQSDGAVVTPKTGLSERRNQKRKDFVGRTLWVRLPSDLEDGMVRGEGE